MCAIALRPLQRSAPRQGICTGLVQAMACREWPPQWRRSSGWQLRRYRLNRTSSCPTPSTLVIPIVRSGRSGWGNRGTRRCSGGSGPIERETRSMLAALHKTKGRGYLPVRRRRAGFSETRRRRFRLEAGSGAMSHAQRCWAFSDGAVRVHRPSRGPAPRLLSGDGRQSRRH